MRRRLLNLLTALSLLLCVAVVALAIRGVSKRDFLDSTTSTHIAGRIHTSQWLFFSDGRAIGLLRGNYLNDSHQAGYAYMADRGTSLEVDDRFGRRHAQVRMDAF